VNQLLQWWYLDLLERDPLVAIFNPGNFLFGLGGPDLM